MFDDEQILAAAAASISEAGSRASVASIARRIGAPSGSIYHRYPSRDVLIATTWLRAVRHFQAGFLTALADPDLDAAATGAARHVPLWCSSFVDEAIVLHGYRIDDLVLDWPAQLDGERATVNRDLETALRHHAVARFGKPSPDALQRTRFALVDIPYAAVSRHLDRRTAPPPWTVDAVGVAALSVLQLGARRH